MGRGGREVAADDALLRARYVRHWRLVQHTAAWGALQLARKHYPWRGRGPKLV